MGEAATFISFSTVDRDHLSLSCHFIIRKNSNLNSLTFGLTKRGRGYDNWEGLSPTSRGRMGLPLSSCPLPGRCVRYCQRFVFSLFGFGFVFSVRQKFRPVCVGGVVSLKF